MSHHKHHFQLKNNNPLHSSFIVPRENHVFNEKFSDSRSKLSHLYTKATSEFQYDQRQSGHIIAQYETRIKNLQSGYERSKQQYEISIKNMYKEKMILMNIISSNQNLVDEFRSKIKLHSNSSFKQVEIKYNIISSGLFHNKLCNQCIANIISLDIQGKSIEKESYNPEIVNKSKLKKFVYAKQYSWAFIPSQENLMVAKLKMEVSKLKSFIEEMIQQNSKKLHEKTKEIQLLKHQSQILKNQLSKAVTPIQKIITIASPRQSQYPVQSTERFSPKYKQLIMQREIQISSMKTDQQKLQTLLRQTNEKLVILQLQRINTKFKGNYY